MLEEPHASLDAIPGASGHASAYVPARRPDPLILLAGFDLDASHVASEEIDYGDPAVTAREVVDRESLKAFVREAGRYFGGLLRTGGRAAVSQAKVAMRDENGPWRHGSVYLYVLDLATNLILFHGVFPDRFELRPLVATVRDVVTGELILPQVIEAAKASPEGGFVEYFFDDPTDDTDSADIPKVGFARQFSTEGFNVIIGSGFYGSAVSTDIRDAAGGAVAGPAALAPAVPNPFNSSTRIGYSLSAPGPVRLVIHNVLGQPVRALVDRFQGAGSHRARWDARDDQGAPLSSGVYIARLTHPGGVETRRLLYLE